jgi:hypothetical protein
MVPIHPVVLEKKSEMAATAGLSLTVDPMEKMFKVFSSETSKSI